MQIDIKQEVKLSFDIVLKRYTDNKWVLAQQEFDSDLFDVALEGLSYVWLKYPDLISERLEEFYTL